MARHVVDHTEKSGVQGHAQSRRTATWKIECRENLYLASVRPKYSHSILSRGPNGLP